MRLAFIPYLMAGDPDLDDHEAVARRVERGRARISSNWACPIAIHSPTGRRSRPPGSERSRTASVADVLALAKRCSGDSAPIVLFTYYNPVYQFGLQRFAAAAADAGAAGAIVPDLALEESAALREALADAGAGDAAARRTVDAARARAPDRRGSSGFVYVVSRLGVTGAGKAPDFAPCARRLRRCER